ncbi:hypothetical protein HK405_002541 [Cladochytrium tenue]|nr:hypothetical protein HK405_002541 [Cladochytrium tenue]
MTVVPGQPIRRSLSAIERRLSRTGDPPDTDVPTPLRSAAPPELLVRSAVTSAANSLRVLGGGVGVRQKPSSEISRASQASVQTSSAVAQQNSSFLGTASTASAAGSVLVEPALSPRSDSGGSSGLESPRSGGRIVGGSVTPQLTIERIGSGFQGYTSRDGHNSLQPAEERRSSRSPSLWSGGVSQFYPATNSGATPQLTIEPSRSQSPPNTSPRESHYSDPAGAVAARNRGSLSPYPTLSPRIQRKTSFSENLATTRHISEDGRVLGTEPERQANVKWPREDDGGDAFQMPQASGASRTSTSSHCRQAEGHRPSIVMRSLGTLNTTTTLGRFSQSTRTSRRASTYTMDSSFYQDIALRTLLLKILDWMNAFRSRVEDYLIISVQIGLCILVLLILMIGVELVLVLALAVTFPTIGWYNILQSVLSLLGKNLLVVGVFFSQLCAKASTSSALVNSTRGIPLVELTYRFGTYNPREGRALRWTFAASVVVVEAVLWLVSYEFKWTTKYNYIGNFACSLPSYDVSSDNGDLLNITTNLTAQLQSSISQASFYTFGLPLADGIVGGWAAWPLAAPYTSFSMQTGGFIYVIKSGCSGATPSERSLNNSSVAYASATFFDVTHQVDDGQTYRAVISVDSPPRTYAADEYAGRRVAQACNVTVSVGVANLTVAFTADEWHGVTLGGIESIQRSPHLLLAQQSSSGTTTAEVLAQVQSADSPANASVEVTLLRAIASGVAAVFSQAGSVAAAAAAADATRGRVPLNPLLRWAQAPAAHQYAPELMARGIGAAVAAVAQRVLRELPKADASGVGNDVCAYYGDAGAGTASVPGWMQAALTAALAGCTGAQLAVAARLLWRARGAGRRRLADTAARLIEDPLLLLFALRTSLPRLVTGMPPRSKNGGGGSRRNGDGGGGGGGGRGGRGRGRVRNSDGRAALRRHLAGVRVRYGEDPATCDAEVGRVLLDVPEKLVGLQGDRVYAL